MNLVWIRNFFYFFVVFINNSTSILVVRRIMTVVTFSASVSLVLAINWACPRSSDHWHTVDHDLMWVLYLDLLGVLHRVSHLVLHIMVKTRVIRLSVTWNQRSSWSGSRFDLHLGSSIIIIIHLAQVHTRVSCFFFLVSLFVYLMMSQSLVTPSKSFWTVFAGVWLLTGVDSQMSPDVIGSREPSVARFVWTLKRFLAGVHSGIKWGVQRSWIFRLFFYIEISNWQKNAVPVFKW